MKTGVLAKIIALLSHNILLRYLFVIIMVALAVGLRSLITGSRRPGLPTYITFYPAADDRGHSRRLLAGHAGDGVVGAICDYLVNTTVLCLCHRASRRSGRRGVVCGHGPADERVADLYRRTREQALAMAEASKEAQVAVILENMSEGVVACTIDGDVFQWNRAGLEQFGFATLADVSESCRSLPSFLNSAS